MKAMSDQLSYLAASYFHEDYDLEAPTPLDVIRVFALNEPREDVQQLAEEVRSLIASRSEAELKEAWLNTYDAYYEPDRRDGMTYRQWFEQVLEILEGR